ncbi:hypothetical protein L3Q82_007003 [Scortum barcoo]|uniref:Uncharacterized protein n=1 Tax=Scortum barcoo TaxID=214431 RepID=A0ACB8WVS0_9TELE|nr:hypothetical protein L3Q82_007003 [Scortum barcoo]
MSRSSFRAVEEDMLFSTSRTKQQIPELLDEVEKMCQSENKPYCYSAATFAQAQMEKNIQLQRLMKEDKITSDDVKQSPESLRIVLIREDWLWKELSRKHHCRKKGV